MKILIAYDGSESSQAAVTDLRLAGLAPATQAVVLSVLDGRGPEHVAGLGGTRPGEAEVRPGAVEAFERQRGIADDGAARVRALFPGWGVSAEVRVGSPAWEIIRRAEGEEGHADGDPMDLVVITDGAHFIVMRSLVDAHGRLIPARTIRSRCMR